MRKRIVLWLTALLLSAAVFTGCTDEDMQLVGELLELVLEAGETAPQETLSPDSWGEDAADFGAVSEFGGDTQETADREEQSSYNPETESESESSAEYQKTEVPDTTETGTEAESEEETLIAEDGEYLSAEDVALYIATYGCLPSNYMTKDEAEELGWSSREGNLWEVAPGACIGGDRFGNYEGILPKKSGRKYTECDVNYDGGYRSAERIVFSNDGLVYYTEDHYETFTLLYGEE